MLIWKSQRTVIFVCVILIIGRKLVIFIIYRLLMLKTKILNLSNPSHMVTMDGKTYHKNDVIKHISVVTDFIIRPEDDSGSTVILQTYILNSYVGGMWCRPIIINDNI